MMSLNGSNDPVLTLPACRHTMLGLLIAGNASARIRPCASTGTVITRDRPSPTTPSALNKVV